ncbi:hypothetical protein GDO86_005304, partial [Hymenochirus boettgeri]
MGEIAIKETRWQVRFILLFSWLYHSVSAQLHYSIAEELRKDSIIANIAKDLGLDVNELSSRQFQIVSRVSEKYFYVDLKNGNLYVKDRIDRETLCGVAATCFLSFDAMVADPLNIFSVKVEIQDVNDNDPIFSPDVISLEISEATSPGIHLALQNAEDPDIGINTVQVYRLSDSNYFTLSENPSIDDSKFPELVLEKPLDCETKNIHELILTATDGGNPARSGSATIRVIVTDANDNLPIFTQTHYKVSISENTPINSTVLTVNATDKDEGINAQIMYSFSKRSDLFNINPTNGEIKTQGILNFEQKSNFEMSVQAKDGGGFVAHCKVLIEIIDENDNTPEITIASFFSPIPEDSAPGTVIALIEVHDQDSGENGEVDCQIMGTTPFHLVSSSSRYYRITTTSMLDREKVSLYNITILAIDRGSPTLSSTKYIKLEISDINDNPPIFMESTYVTYLPENNLPGVSVCTIHASDLDVGDNAKVTYLISNTNVDNLPVSSYFSINIETGILYAQRSFDYEQHKEFNLEIMAKDNGSPSLSSNSTLLIHIMDQNDNAPNILYPPTESGASTLFELVPSTALEGSLITKVVAVDSDSGHNGWLSYHFIQPSDPSHFSISTHTGEIRILRIFQAKDILKHKLVVMVRDNGDPYLSATVTLSLIVADHFQQMVPKLTNQLSEDGSQSNLQIYLVIALAVITIFFILTIILVIISKCKETKPFSAFGPPNSNFYSQVDPKVLSQFNDGTLSLPYSYNVCVAVDSSGSDFTFLNSKRNVPVDNLIDTDDSELQNESMKESASLSQYKE